MIACFVARARSCAARTRQSERAVSPAAMPLVWHSIARLENVGVREARALKVVAVGDLEAARGEPAQEGVPAKDLRVPDHLELGDRFLSVMGERRMNKLWPRTAGGCPEATR